MLLLLLLSSFVSASDMDIKKKIEKDTLEVGEAAQISLEVTNPFLEDVMIQIADKNVFANNGLDIQCLEKVIPKLSAVVLDYDPLQAYGEGDFTLEPATLKYTDPETGEEKQATSNTVNLSVKGGSTQGTGSGITTVYECGGTSMRSTSYSGGSSSMQISIGNNGMTIQQQMNQAQQDAQQAQQQAQDMMNQALQNMQQSQDMNSLREQMQRDQQQTMQNEQALRDQIEQNQEFQDMMQELSEQGFNMTDSQINPQSNTTGDFQYNFQNEKGQQAKLSGNVQNQSIENLTKEIIDPVSELEEDETQDNQRAWYRWLLVFLILAAVLGYVFSKYFKPKQVIKEVKTIHKPVNYTAQAKKLIEKAQKQFDNGEKKEAYHTASFALRYYLTHKLGASRELTASAALDLMKEKSIEAREANDFFNLCSLVGFAKYKPNKKDFDDIVELAKGFMK